MRIDEVQPVRSAGDIPKVQHSVASAASETTQESSHRPTEAVERSALPTVDVGAVVDQLNQLIGALDSRVSFEVNEKLDRAIIQVIDNESGEVVRQIPGEVMLRLLERMVEMIGFMVDKEA